MRRCICGEKPKVEKDGPVYDYCYRVVCPNCGLKCPSAGRDKDDAEESWNRFISRINVS